MPDYQNVKGRVPNRLKGKEGDKINAILGDAGMNISKLLRWLVDYFLLLLGLRPADPCMMGSADQFKIIGFSGSTIHLIPFLNL
nr:hypothetical protein [uncultured Desulfobacter sp.]